MIGPGMDLLGIPAFVGAETSVASLLSLLLFVLECVS